MTKPSATAAREPVTAASKRLLELGYDDHGWWLTKLGRRPSSSCGGRFDDR